MMEFRKQRLEEEGKDEDMTDANKGELQKGAAMTEKQFFAMMAEDLEDKKIGWKRIVNQPEKKGCAIQIHKKVIEG